MIKMTSVEQRVFMDISEQEFELTKETAIAKSKFTLYRNRLLLIIERPVMPVTELDSAYRKMDAHMETTMDVMAKLTEIYIKCKQLDKGSKIVVLCTCMCVFIYFFIYFHSVLRPFQDQSSSYELI